jgi:mannosyltransferase
LRVQIDGIIYSLQRHGGITVYFNELLQRMRAEEAGDFRVMLYEGSAANFELLPASYETRPMRLAERYRRCQVHTQADLFHSSYYRLPDRRVPVVTTVHDFIYERFAYGPRKWLHSWQKLAAIRESQAVICISESTRRDLLQFLPDIRPERLHVIHNGVSSAFRPLDSVSMNTGIVRPYVLFVGARSGYKNFIPLVQAMAGLRDLDLVCIGGGALTPQESKLVKRQLGDRFVHHMGVTDVKLNKFYNGAFCLAYPSAYEGFGIPVLEAMRAGCPVVAMNSSSIPEVAGNAAQLLPEASPEALQAAIHRLDQSGQRENFRQLGLQRATLFSWDRTFAETFKVYEEVRSGY